MLEVRNGFARPRLNGGEDSIVTDSRLNMNLWTSSVSILSKGLVWKILAAAAVVGVGASILVVRTLRHRRAGHRGQARSRVRAVIQKIFPTRTAAGTAKRRRAA
jgi:hypothetical protein